jgi:hypothetical protein
VYILHIVLPIEFKVIEATGAVLTSFIFMGWCCGEELRTSVLSSESSRMGVHGKGLIFITLLCSAVAAG